MAKLEYQRNAFVPAVLAAIVLLVSPLLFTYDLGAIVLYAVTILAAIVAWFAVQARQWWWLIVFVPVVVVWNPVYPLGLSGQLWLAAQFVCAAAFVAAGVLIKSPRE